MKFARIGALAAPAAGIAMSKDPPPTKVWKAIKAYTGVDYTTGKFNLSDLGTGWLPFLATSAVTYGIQKLNGMIRRM